MKKIISLILMMGLLSLYAQNTADRFTTASSDQSRDPRADQMNFVPNEVIVKFKDEVPLSSGARLRAAGVSAVDKVLKANRVDSLVRLFPGASGGMLRSAKAPRIVKDPQGRDMKIPNLDKIFKMTLPQLRSSGGIPANIFQFIEELKALPEVEYAEPNYIYSIDDLQPVGPILTADDVKKMQSTLRSSQSAVVPNDPLYNQQWYIPAVKADLVWEQTTGDTTQVIGILDTGVDWNHPDLKNKIWTNPNPNTTPDANGVVNDIRGWDYINNDNNPMDDNSHGTHVAGIAAAETNNGIGIAGVNWNAKIMPIKVFQSSGRGDVATITKGIIYAANYGATVINMSFGSYTRSLTMEAALANAYGNCILVAAAGNDGRDIEDRIPPSRFYPAALSYVLGVVSPEAGFSNTDHNGPTFSTYEELNNYEMKAPGKNIISTIPNGNYRVYQGTSMAAPIVAGAVCLYISKHPNESQELMWGNLINTTGEHLNINSAVNIVPTPKLMFVNKTMVDTLAGDNNNELINAGETIQLWFNIRNTWGQCDSVKIGIKFAEFEDLSTAQIITPTALIGSVSPYATRTNEKNPLTIHINSNVAHNRDINFTAFLTYPNSTDTVKQDIVLNVKNGVELSGVMDTTKILTPDVFWLVDNSFRIGLNGHLIIKPGTQLNLMNPIINRGELKAIGTKDSLILISGPQSYGGGGTFYFKYCDISEIYKTLGDPSQLGYAESGNYVYEHCIIEGSRISIFNQNSAVLFYANSLNIKESVIKNCIADFGLFETTGGYIIEKNNFSNNLLCSMVTGYIFNRPIDAFGSLKYNNFSNFDSPFEPHPTRGDAVFSISGNSNSTQVYNNFIGFNHDKEALITTGTNDIVSFKNQYWGSIDFNKIKNSSFDFWQDPSKPQIEYKPFLTAPSDSAHAIVWKVLVNGKDAQDEEVDPIGVGRQRFDVYFNRSMDTTITPQVSFGVRFPYNQQPVYENGVWSTDGRIYTVYKSIKLTTGDGINRIRVAGAKETNGWEHEIPVEDQRFNLLISAASSASLDFMATPGLGKVKLEWNNNDLADGLGYNMYRMEHINDSTLTSPVIVNTSLITDTLYTDYSVTPNNKYYYFYKIVRTDLSETDSSRVVSAIPFTAAKGDANGDLSVNVLDITSIVAYLLNNNPQPFIFEAADFNSDSYINVLDIVGVVNLVLYGNLRSATISQNQQASLYMENDTLFANTSAAIGGLQLDLSGVSSINDVQVLNALQGFESGYSQTGIDSLRLIYYSMSGKTIPVGNRIPLLKLKEGSKIVEAIVSDHLGAAIPLSLTAPSIGNSNDQKIAVADLGQNYPNPSNGLTILPVQLFENVDEAVIHIFNVFGQEVKVLKLSDLAIGKHYLPWNSGDNKGMFVYKLEIRKGNQQYICPVKKMIVL